MPTKNHEARAAVRHLKSADPTMARVINRVGPCRLERQARPDVFHDLAHSIVYQQLNGTAAGTIFGRFKALYPGVRFPSPEAILKTTDARLRSAGLSPQKLSYMKDLAAKVKDGTLNLGSIKNWDDEEVIEHLTQVKGVGRWTAEMVLIFTLGRPDVLPVDDYGFQRGLKESYKLRQWPKANKIKSMAEPWRPYRSYGTWYVWRSLSQ
jgi:DNA-3-methyladenine glycosylase II